jgi:hypothetical protein
MRSRGIGEGMGHIGRSAIGSGGQRYMTMFKNTYVPASPASDEFDVDNTNRFDRRYLGGCS